MTLCDKIEKDIIEDILDGKITFETVLTESSLTKKYKVSRSPVREALTRLCCQDILRSIPRYGYKLVAIDKLYFDSIIQLRAYIEPYYLRQCFYLIDSDKINTLKEGIENVYKTKTKNPIHYWKKTSDFHLDLARCYNNEFYLNTLTQILERQHIIFAILYWNVWKDVEDFRMHDTHSTVLEAIINGDVEIASNLLELDILSF